MKRTLLLFLIALSTSVFADGSVTIKGNGDLSFNVYFNNVLQNNQVKNKHFIEDIPAGNYQVTIEVFQPYYRKITKTIFVKNRFHRSYRVTRNGAYVNLSYRNQTRVSSFKAAPAIGTCGTNNPDNGVIIIDHNGNQTTYGNNGTYGTYGNNGNINNGTFGNNGNMNNGNNGTVIIGGNNNTLNGACIHPVSSYEFNSIKNSIRNQTFTSNKKAVAKQVINSNCLTARQIKQIVDLFNFDSAKLEISKMAYHRVYDPRNYYLVNNSFQFSSSVTSLNRYINKNKRY